MKNFKINDYLKIKMIVGLGNPFKKYKYTRHNIGSFLLHKLSKIYFLNFLRNKYLQGYVANLKVYHRNIILFIPDVFMNLNGFSVLKAINFFKVCYNQILFIHDELDLKLMNLKLRIGNGCNGHNGLKSLRMCFPKKKYYCRLSIGIDRPNIFNNKKIIKHVLSVPKNKEKILFYKSINYGIKSILLLIKTRSIKHTRIFLNNLKN